MKFTIKKGSEKEKSIYKTLYIQKNLNEKIEKLAKENDTSWNRVVISMIEACLEEE